ncbi:hypothetical protein ACJROX_14630 [Pseudalkalibacillus sp. A8]|uniref:ATP-dependent DNA ligase n=1 Tax=Pseudalkalibacillus sp. A8 TaxID=3382641 RepID=UPI0038B48192
MYQLFLNSTIHISSPVTYVVFDILFYKGKDLRKLPLDERKRILNEVIEITKPSQRSGISRNRVNPILKQ